MEKTRAANFKPEFRCSGLQKETGFAMAYAQWKKLLAVNVPFSLK
jgi:hypothetical protein